MRSLAVVSAGAGTPDAQHAPGGDVRIGISGWRYAPWRNVFYPPKLAQKRELSFAATQFRTVEINGSFYSLQRPSSYQAWYDATPPGFVFGVKGGKFITHNKKLRECRGPLANFFASGVLALEEKLGPILWQLPPQLSFGAERLEEFFALLPRTTAQAAELAREHDNRLKHGSYIDARTDRPLRYALEVRHESFDDPAFIRILRKHSVALCVADTAGRWPHLEDVTADFVYARLHGDKKLYVSGYSPASLDAWAARISAWRDGDVPKDATLAAPRAVAPSSRRPRDVYAYFDNDVKVRAPFDALNLAARLGQGKRAPFPRRAHREAEAARGVEEARSTWGRWGPLRRA